MDPSAPGWYPDPYGRHDRRYWSGVRWSRHVDDLGHRTTDPVGDSGPTQRSPQRMAASPTSRRPAALVGGIAAVFLAATVAVLLTRRDDNTDPIAADDPLRIVVVEALHERSAGITDSQVSCMADRLIGNVGANRMTELGVLDGADPLVALDQDEKEAAFPAAFDCLDDPGMVAFMAPIWDSEVARGLSPEVAPCIFRRLIDELGRDRVVELYTTFARPQPMQIEQSLRPSEDQPVGDAISECVASSALRRHDQ